MGTLLPDSVRWPPSSLPSRPSRFLKWFVALVVVVALWGELRSSLSSATSGTSDCKQGLTTIAEPMTAASRNNNNNNNGIIYNQNNNSSSNNNNPMSFDTNASIPPGGLPGYTGWARPEKTLARHFSVVSAESSLVTATVAGSNQKRSEYTIRVKCEGHRHCFPKNKFKYHYSKNGDAGPSLFFLRAYGPAVVSGTVVSRSCTSKSDGNGSDADKAGAGCSYDIRFAFFDPGLYTIEAVLTFSNPPPISVFPLGKGAETNEQDTHYEGYLLPGFPLLATVALDGTEEPSAARKDCALDDLTETSPASAREKARWKVTGKVNEKGYSSSTMNSPLVTQPGYRSNANSLGINFEYQHANQCRIVSEASFRDERPEENLFSKPGCGTGKKQKIRIVYIGDSVLRVQRDTLQGLLEGPSSDREGFQFEFDFLSLHEGYRKNQALGPASVQDFLRDIQKKSGADTKVAVLFNTGLHDIHRLCGSEFKLQRLAYLDNNALTTGSFACVDEYRALLRDFLETMDEFPATLKVFQTTTSAWPKYGNFGIEWSEDAQDMPLVSDFSAAFNEIAFGVLADHELTAKGDGDRIAIMDGYWITHPRADNREIGSIGKKLSHPGEEVLSAMARIWAMIIQQRVCHNA